MQVGLAILAGSVAVAGCGGTSASHTAARAADAHGVPPRTESRADVPVSSDGVSPVQITPEVKAQEEALHAQVIAALHAPEPTNQPPGIPSYIPKPTHQPGSIETATFAHPRLAIEGDALVISIAQGKALANVNGPYLAAKYAATNDPTVPARWVLDITGKGGAFPLRASDFTITDELGPSIVPHLQVQGGGPLPSTLKPGQHLTLVFTSIVPVGNGQLQYSPKGIVRGKVTPLAGWDFDVEDD